MSKAKAMPKSVKLPFDTPGCLAVSPNGLHLVVSEGMTFDGRLWHIDGAAGVITDLAPVAGMVSSLALADDGRLAIAFHSEACDKYKSSGQGSPGGALIELRDGAGARLHQIELDVPYAALSFGAGDLLHVQRDGIGERHPPLVGIINAATGKLERARVAFSPLAGAAAVNACFVEGGTTLLAVGEVNGTRTLMHVAVDGSVTMLAAWSFPSAPRALVSVGSDRVLAVLYGSAGWRLLDSDGKELHAGKETGLAGCADADGFLVASGNQAHRFGLDGALRESKKLKVAVTSVAASRTSAFGLGRQTIQRLS